MLATCGTLFVDTVGFNVHMTIISPTCARWLPSVETTNDNEDPPLMHIRQR